MGAGTKGQARIQQQIDRFGFRGLVPAGDDPQPLAEAHRLEVVHPAAFPLLVFQALHLVGQAVGQQLHALFQGGGVGIAFEQRQQVGLGPQRGGAEIRFEDRLVLGVHEGHRDGAQFEHEVFVGFRLGGREGEADLQPGHGGLPESGQSGEGK